MKKMLLISALLITPAYAQQPAEFNLKVTAAEIDVISEGLQTQPFGKVFPLINKLRQQVIEQSKPPAEAPKPADEPAK
jgi:hypothetical protein